MTRPRIWLALLTEENRSAVCERLERGPHPQAPDGTPASRPNHERRRPGPTKCSRGRKCPGSTLGHSSKTPQIIYGADEECIPPEASKEVWRRAATVSGNSYVTVVDLPGCGHIPVEGEPPVDLDFTVSDLSPGYTAALHSWFARRP